MSFVNFSNHSSVMWNEKQAREAEKWGTIVDIAFPNITADADEQEIEALAGKYVELILKEKPDAVMCQGEFTLVFSVVTKLKKLGITVVSACSNRVAVEKVLSNGSSQKSSVFKFVKFREYK